MSGIVVVGGGRGGRLFGREEDDALWTRNNIVWGNIMVDNCLDDARDLERFPGWGNRAELIMPDVNRETNYNNISDYNIMYRTDGRPVGVAWTGWGHRGSLEDRREETGSDKHSVIAEPLFIDREGRDFRPAPDSPAIAFARPFTAVRDDFEGRYRPFPYIRESYATAGPFEVELED